MKLSLTLATTLGLASLISSTALASDEATRQSLIAFNDRFNELAASHNIEGLVALYHEDAYWIAPDALPAQGRDGVPRQTITFMSQNQGELSHTIDELFISEDGTQAVMMGVTAAAVEAVGLDFEGTYIYVLERQSEQEPWQIVVDMYNNHPAE